MLEVKEGAENIQPRIYCVWACMDNLHFSLHFSLSMYFCDLLRCDSAKACTATVAVAAGHSWKLSWVLLRYVILGLRCSPAPFGFQFVCVLCHAVGWVAKERTCEENMCAEIVRPFS